jgi:hypothetical protein
MWSRWESYSRGAETESIDKIRYSAKNFPFMASRYYFFFVLDMVSFRIYARVPRTLKKTYSNLKEVRRFI